MRDVILALCNALRESGLAVTEKFPPRYAPRLREAIVAVSLRQLQGASCGFADYLGLTDDGKERYGKRIKAEFLCRIAAPDGAAASLAADSVCAALVGGINGVFVREMTVGQAQFDERADCFTLDVTALVTASLYAEQTGDDPAFLDFKLECEPK